MDLTKYKSLFLTESREHLQGMTEKILQFREHPSEEALDWMFRAAHSIKGMSASMGYEPVATLTHKIETVLDRLKKGDLAFDDNARDALFHGIDLIHAMLNGIDSGEESRISTNSFEASLKSLRMVSAPHGGGDKFLYRIEMAFSKDSVPDAASRRMALKRIEAAGRISKVIPSSSEVSSSAEASSLSVYLVTSWTATNLEELLKEIVDLDHFVLAPVDPHTRSSTEAEPSARAESIAEPLRMSTVRVETEKIDQVIDNLGDLLIQQAQLEEQFPDASGLDRLQTMGRRIYEAARDLRMLPFETLASRIPRMIYDLGKKLDKNVRVKMEGMDLQMDKAVLAELSDPLIHLIRNAVDHGIEPPAVRAATRKAETATITVSAVKKGDRLHFIVEDDGRGIDPQIVKKIAIEKGLIEEKMAAQLNSQELLMLITRPGFSTSDFAGEISGRGVGLDAVRAKIDSLSGDLRIYSMPGRYTRFEMILPFTIALISALVVRIGNFLCAVPLSRVDRVVLLHARHAEYTNGRPVIYNENEALHVENLTELLFGRKNELPEEFPAFVTEHQSRRIAWMVDELVTEKQIVLKLIGPLQEMKWYAGATIFSKGEVVPVLDIEQIYREHYE